MTKPYTIRPLKWDDVDQQGCPLDALDIMEFFNDALDTDAFPLVPRREYITSDEIASRWVPSANNKINYVAEDDETGKIVAAGVMFVDQKKQTGVLSVTKDPDCSWEGVGTDLTKKVIDETLKQGITAVVYTSVENKAMIRVMEKLGYAPHTKIPDYEPYKGKIVSDNFDVYEWRINP